MNRRWLSSFVSLLYASVALVFGCIHHHHHHEHADADGHDDECSACQWQLQATTDVPVLAITPILLGVVVLQTLPIPTSVPAEPLFCSSTASRAPPAASA